MRNLSVFILALFFLLSCGEEDVNGGTETPSESLIDTRFQTCYYENDLALKQSNSVLISIFGKSTFEQNIRLNAAESSMNCQVGDMVELVPFGDSTYCVPNSFDLSYSLLQDGEAIYSFRFVAGQDMVFEPVSTIVQDQLTGYRKLLKGEFTIDYANARSIAAVNGIDFTESSLELVKSDDGTYHWEAELEYDHNSVALLLIDALSGKTSTEVLRIETVL